MAGQGDGHVRADCRTAKVACVNLRPLHPVKGGIEPFADPDWCADRPVRDAVIGDAGYEAYFEAWVKEPR